MEKFFSVDSAAANRGAVTSADSRINPNKRHKLVPFRLHIPQTMPGAVDVPTTVADSDYDRKS